MKEHLHLTYFDKLRLNLTNTQNENILEHSDVMRFLAIKHISTDPIDIVRKIKKVGQRQ